MEWININYVRLTLGNPDYCDERSVQISKNPDFPEEGMRLGLCANIRLSFQNTLYIHTL